MTVTEVGLKAETGLTIKNNYCGIGAYFTLHLLIIKFHYIGENKIIPYHLASEVLIKMTYFLFVYTVEVNHVNF